MSGGKGLIHGDTNTLNYIDDGKEVCLIDIDSPDVAWYAIDIARTFGRPDPNMTPKQRAGLYESFMTGYGSIRPIDLDYEAVRWLMRQHMFVTYVAYARMPNPEQRAYLKRWYSFVENPDQW